MRTSLPPTPELFHQLVLLLPEPLLLVSAEGVLVDGSASACTLLGLDASALHGRPLAEWVTDAPERLASYLRLCARTPQPLPGALTLRPGTGEPVRRSCYGARLEPEGAEHPPLVLLRFPAGATSSTFGLLSRKVEELTKEVLIRRETEDELRRASELLEQLIGIASHDVRSPLSAVLMSVTHLMQSNPDERTRKGLERIERGGRRIEQMVRLLLDFTQARQGKGIPVQPRPLDVHELCTRVVDELKTTHPQRTVEVLGTPVEGEADPERLFQVLANLLENAFKYGAAGRPVTLRTSELGDEVRVSVHNEGEPIPEALLPRIFEPFSRGPQTEETVKVSLGLGLYIVKELVHAHGGTVEVSSTPQEGTRFTVRLPRWPKDRKSPLPLGEG